MISTALRLATGRLRALSSAVLALVLVLGSSVVLSDGQAARAEAEERTASHPGPVAPLGATSDPSELAGDLVGAIARPELEPRILEATYEGVVEQAAVFDAPLQEFPRSGNQYIVLSTGPAESIPGTATDFLSVSMGGVHIPGGSPDGLNAFDVATLTVRLDLTDVPTDPEPRLVFRYKFCSEEPPSYWGSGFQDYFTATVRDAGGQDLQNIALLPDGQPFTIDNARPFMNEVTGTSGNPQPPFPSPDDVVFNACTGIHTTDFDLTAFVDEEIELELQIGDVSDAILDSAVFVDGLEVHAGPLPDFWVERVEFNQASQSFAPGQEVAAEALVTRKFTGVRVHVVGDDNEDDPQEISAELHVHRNGQPILGSPFRPLPRRIAPVEAPSRTAMDGEERATDTFEFRLPRSATLEPGDYQFFVVVDPHNEVDEADTTNNRFPAEGFETVTFHEATELRVLPVHVTTVDGEGDEVNTFDAADWDRHEQQRFFTHGILPQRVTFPAAQSLEWNLDGPTGWWLWSEPGGDLATRDGRRALFAEINDIREDTGAHTVVAILPRDTDLDGANGWGFVGRPGAIVRTAANSTLVHEIAHNLLPRDTFGPPDTNHDPTDSGDDGYDPRLRLLKVDKDNILHVGSNDPWVSPTSYDALFEHNELVDGLAGASAGGGFAAAGQGTQALRIIGWVDDEGELRLRPIHTVEAEALTPSDPSGDYVVDLLDAAGQTLGSLQFDHPLQPVHGGPDVRGPFSLVVPRPEGLASLVFEPADPADPPLGVVPVSEHAPTVDVVSPAGGEQISGTFTVEWQGSDADGDPLAYTVLYSPDEGDSWNVLATNLTSTSLEWDTSAVPGGTGALIKVRATDGVNSGSDQSAAFTVAKKSPDAFIVSPESGATVSLGAVADFFGGGVDPEDGELDDDDLEWSSDLDGVLGTGAALSTTELSEGTHTITLTATDSDANTGTDAITISVVDTTPAPPTGVQAVPGDEQVTLEWEASPGEFTQGYRVYWGTASGVYGAHVDAGDATSRTITGLVNDTPYFFAVTAYDAVGNESGFSDEVEATPGLLVQPPATFGAACFVESPNHNWIRWVDTIWSAVPDASSYHVYHQEVVGGEPIGEPVLRWSGTGTSFQDFFVPHDRTFDYWATALGPDGVESVPSNVVRIDTTWPDGCPSAQPS